MPVVSQGTEDGLGKMNQFLSDPLNSGGSGDATGDGVRKLETDW